MGTDLTAATDKLSRAGFAGPVRFVGLTDTAIDADGNTAEFAAPGTCALCGESLRYVVHFVDAKGLAFDAGSNCAKWAQLSPADKKAVAASKREAAALAKAERAEPGYIARKILERAESAAAYKAAEIARLAAFRAQLAAVTEKLARVSSPAFLVKAQALDLADEVSSQITRLTSDVERLSFVVESFEARIATL